MARSTYYFEINKTDPVAIRNEELLLVIKKIFVENKGRYGVRRVYMENSIRIHCSYLYLSVE